MATCKKTAITPDEELVGLLEICLSGFDDNRKQAQKQPYDNDPVYYTVGNISWLLKKLATSSQFTPEQQALFTQVDNQWHQTLFPSLSQPKPDTSDKLPTPSLT